MTRSWLPLVAVLTALASACQGPSHGQGDGDLHGRRADPGDPESLYEIRSYHFEPALIDEYRAWAREDALPFLAERLEIVGFWVTTSDPAEVGGAPLDELGSANVTWIIRWPSLEARDEKLPEILASEGFQDVFSRVPGGPESYLRTEARFAEGLPHPR